MNRPPRPVAAALLALFLHVPAAAQEPAPPRLAVEPQLSIAFPRGALAERWGVGAGLGVQVSLWLDSSHALYAGYGGTQFDLDVVDDEHAIDRGLSAGIVRSFADADGRALVPWVRVGVLAHRLSVVDAGSPSGPGDGGVGLEVGAGITVRRSRVRAVLGQRLRAFPAVGLEHRVYRARVLGDDRETVSYLAVRAGMALVF